MRSITFFTDTYPDEKQCAGAVKVLHSWQSVERALCAKEETIYTTQMGELSTWLLEYGYRIFVVDGVGKYEIAFGTENERTDIPIRPRDNLLNRWVTGEFDAAEELSCDGFERGESERTD